MICQVFALLTPFLRFGCAMSWETLHLSKTVNHFLMINWFLVTFRVLNGGKWWIWNWDKRNAFLIFTLWWLFRFHNFSNSLEDASLQENFLTLESAEKIYNSNLFSSFTICVLEFSFFRLNIICIRKHKRGRGRGLVCQWKPIEVERIFAIFFFCVCVCRSMQMKEQENFENLHFTLATAAPKLSSSRNSHNPREAKKMTKFYCGSS